MAELINQARVDAEYDSVPTYAESIATVQMPAISLIKAASATTWTGDELTYTATVRNIENAATGLPATDVVFTDTINPNYATLVNGSVTVNGTVLDPVDYTFNATTGLLTIPLDDIDPQDEVVITFRVRKV